LPEALNQLKNPAQIDAFLDPTRHRSLNCGRRGGKTFLLRESLLAAIDECPNGGEGFYFGPTNAQAREIMWDALMEGMDSMGWRYRDLISKSRFELPGKRKLYVLGAEKASRARGHAIYFLAMDETAFWQHSVIDIWQKVFRPALSDHAGAGQFGGRAIAATTPNGKGTPAYDFYTAAIESEDWGVHQWFTKDNPWIDKDEIEAAKRELDSMSFRQEYEASWETAENLAYYSFEEETHVKKQPDPSRGRPLKICLDFNVNPTTLIVSQYDGRAEINRFLREYSLRNSSTEDTIRLFCDEWEEWKDHDWRIRGDSSGRARSSTTGRSDYHYVEKVLTHAGFRYKIEVPARNPAIIDRLKYFNGWLRPVAGGHRVEIDPSCKELIRDLASQALMPNRQPDPSNNLGHKADAAGYDIWWEQITKTRKPQRTVRL